MRIGLIKRTPLLRKMSLRDSTLAKMKREGIKTFWTSSGKLVRKKPPKKMAKNRRTEHQKYMAAFPDWVARPENARCAVCVVLVSLGRGTLVNPTDERHHFRGRHHKLLCWEPGWIPTCRFHREWPHESLNRSMAEEHGIISTRAEWNVYPPELRNA